MGWYKVQRQSFDYAPASLDSILFERGVKEPDSVKVDSATLIRMEREARTLELISSFGDMAGASARAIIKEAMESQNLEKRTRDTFQALLDMEESRGHATLHAMQVAPWVNTQGEEDEALQQEAPTAVVGTRARATKRDEGAPRGPPIHPPLPRRAREANQLASPTCGAAQGIPPRGKSLR